MAEEDDERRRVDKYPGGDQGSLASRPGFTSVGEQRYQTSRYPGFVGGSTDKEGNIMFEGGSALRGIRADRVQDANVQDAQDAYDQQVADDATETARQAETPWGPKDEQHEAYGKTVDNEWSNEQYITETDPGTDIYEGMQESGSEGGYFYVNNPGRDTLVAYDQATGGGTVICTELNRQKLLSDFLCAQSSLHAEQMNPCVIRGYRLWAIPYVRLMRKYPLAVWVVKYIATCRSEEIAYGYCGPGEGNFIGKLARLIGEPICWLIGLFVNDPDYFNLYETRGIE